MIDLYADRPDLYDLLHDDLSADTAFYTGIAGAVVPPGGRVLELGCGSGRIMAALLEGGYRVTGLDKEPAMLKRAERRLANRAGDRKRLVLGDMCRPDLGDERFDLILVSANTFMHLPDHAAHHACLAAIHQHLAQNGTALLDLANPFHTISLPQGVITLRRRGRDAATGYEVTVTGALEVDPTAPTAVDHLFFDLEEEGGTLRRLSSRVELRLVFMPELELLLAARGLGIADAYGDYDLGPYTASAERMIVVIRRL